MSSSRRRRRASRTRPPAPRSRSGASRADRLGEPPTAAATRDLTTRTAAGPTGRRAACPGIDVRIRATRCAPEPRQYDDPSGPSPPDERREMLDIRRDADIHAEEGGWFSARWHFSFDRYHDPEYVHFGPLRVFND